jgi:hypothetical protein
MSKDESKNGENEPSEALHILANARHSMRALDERGKKEEPAAKALLSEVLGIAKRAGFSVSAEGRISGNGRSLEIFASAEGIHVKGTATEPVTEIEYDAVTDTWVGTEPSYYVTPIPGKPVPRRSAAAAVATTIAKVLKAPRT